ncbi:MAG TPA: carboxypeptidase-like regulatory domain-containing protein [Terriglobales bacterium]|nr:carboxypeptidase-like regulatory domain-containing protein [Terriglobales bacterium]
MRKAILACLLLSLVVLISNTAWSQATNTGTVVGVVTDQSNAVVPSANITLADPSTGTSQTATTNDNGRYVFVNVQPGTYTLQIAKEGFATTKISQVSVEVQQTTTMNAALRVGGSSVVVEVTGGAIELQTLNATIGNTVGSDMLQSLPSLGRDVSSFVTMQPGVSPDGSVGGTVVDQANFTLDGGNNSNDMDGSGGVYNPSFGDDPSGGLFSNKENEISGSDLGLAGNQPSGVMPTPVDSVEEFKVSTSNQTADFNNSSGMQVSIVTKRGRNAWHGTAYEYYLDNNFSGNTWENNQTVPKTRAPDWHRSWFGGAIGGPLIPKEVLGGKTYFFVNYQGARWPNSETLDFSVPSPDMRNGILHNVGNPNTTYNLNTLDPRGIGINPEIQQLWTKYMPAGTPGGICPSSYAPFCDNVNTLDFKANLALPQNDNFGVMRVDHDFGSNWHFMSSYRYYHLRRATDQQVDIGGFFAGDKLGVPTSLTNRPQVPWYLVLGMTTNITNRLTNDFRYSFLRNWWQWGSNGDPAQLSGAGAAIEPLGESAGPHSTLIPYNVNNQSTRTRFWNGRDNFFRDDVSFLKGSHLFQFGGQYQRNWNYHQRTDNGAGVNYYPVYQIGDAAGSGSVDLTGLSPDFSDPGLAGNAAAVLGIVTDTQQAFTRSGNSLKLNPPLTPAFDKSTILYYNLYLNDTWKMKPSLTVTYGLGWTLELPPTEETGKQVLLVDASGNAIDAEAYLKSREAAALGGQVYNPEVGFAILPNVAGHRKYPFDPFYHGFSPRIAIAWNPDLGAGLGGKNTVFRGGYGRIYGRNNGVNLVLGPLLAPGLIQAVGCSTVEATNPGVAGSGGTCLSNGTLNASNAFRIGTDGNTAPLFPAASPPSANLPQPFYPGIGGNTESLTASYTDPHLRPNSEDSFDLTIQHQFSSKLSVEVGGISHWIHNELQNINLNTVPYMMTVGGQAFSAAYANVEKAMGCATSLNACNNATAGATLSNLKPQPFFESALAGTGYCTPGNCTATVVTNEFPNFQSQSVWSLWTDLDTGGAAPGFNFPASTMSTAGQVGPGNLGYVIPSTSLGYGNYNAAFVTFKVNDWRGVTLQNNLTWSKALGTGAVVQATSQSGAVDSFDLGRQYGPQIFDRRLVDTMFMVYQPSFYHGQQGLLGHILGGWIFSPIFTTGSGAPLFCGTSSSFPESGYSGSQEFGAGDSQTVFNPGNCVPTSYAGTGASVHTVGGQPTIYSNPTAVFNNMRPLILGLDNRSGGFGFLYGLPYWNMNLGIKKETRVTERVNVEASISIANVLNHNQFLDPVLDGCNTCSGGFGQLTTEGSTPRSMEFGLRVSF